MTKTTRTIMNTFRRLALAAVVTVGAAAAMASPAFAAGWDHGGGWRGHDWHGGWRGHPHAVYAPGPVAYPYPAYPAYPAYGPAPGYYAPGYYAPEVSVAVPGLALGFTLQ